jgi:outer membrane murein-binding lipoprotein Lpp
MRRAAIVAGLVALAGCGSSGMSAKDYRAKADSICTSVRAQRDRLTPASNLEELKAVARSTIAINTDALRRFKALKPSGDLKAPNSVIVTRLQETLQLQEQALKTDPRSTAMRTINGRVAIAHAALIAAARQAKLPACEQL